MKIKVLNLLIIALMLFSCFSMVNAATLTVHARTQDNDGDGWVKFFDSNNKLLSEHYITKGNTRTFNIDGVLDKVDFKSVGRKNFYNADLDGLVDWKNDNNADANIYVDVNFYSKSCYYNNFWINQWVFESRTYTGPPFGRDYLEVGYNIDVTPHRFNGNWWV